MERLRAILVLAAAAAAVVLFPGPGPALAAPMEVNAVASAKSLAGPFEVVGVVSRRDASKGTFALIDREEFARCRQVGCAAFSLPVRWSGKLPAVTATVTVRGTVKGGAGGRFLAADSVEAVAK